jgi:hypothetical protein
LIMNSKEAYVADAQDDLLLGPQIKSMGVAPGIIVVDCGNEDVVANGFHNTVGLNLLDTHTGEVMKNLSKLELATELARRRQLMPELRPLSAYLHDRAS